MDCPNDHCEAQLDEVTEGIWRCPSCDEAWTESELEDARSEGIPFPDLPKLDIAAWPSFVAIPVDQWLEEEHPVQRLNRITDASEVLVRYVCSIAVADLFDRNDGKLPRELREWIAPKVKRPTFGAWIAMVERIIKAADNLQSPRRGPSRSFGRAKTVFKDSILPLLRGESSNVPPEGAVLPLRNHIAHAGGVTREEGERLLNDAGHEQRARETFLDIDDWLSSYVVHYVTDDGDFRQLRGPSAQPTGAGPFPNELADRLEDYCGRVVLRDPEAELLDLTPLCGFGVPKIRGASEQEGRNEREAPEIYVRKETKALRYVPLGSVKSYSERHGDAVERFRQLFDIEAEKTDLLVEHFGEELREDAQARVGRREELDHIVTTLKTAIREDRDGIYWLSGRAGTGKSVLMAAVAAHNKIGGEGDIDLKGADPSSLLLVPWRFKTGDARNSRKAFLQFAVHRIQNHSPLPSRVLDENIDISTAGEDDLANRLAELLEVYEALEPSGDHPRARAPRVLFLLDGLDEIHRKDERVAALPFQNDRSNVIWLCAGRPEAGLIKRFRDRNEVTNLFPPTDNNPDGGLPSMTAQEIRELLETKLVGELGYELRELDEEGEESGEIENPFVDAVVERANGLPMYVELVVEDLNRGDLEISSAVNQLPDTVHHYFDDLLERYELGRDSDIPTRVLSLLTAAEAPLDQSALQALLDENSGLLPDESRADSVNSVDEALDILSPMLRLAPIPDNDNNDPGYRLYHDTFREHIETSDRFTAFVSNAIESLADATTHWSLPDLEPARNYLLRHGLNHLLTARRSSDASELLFTLEFAEAVCKIAGPTQLANFYKTTAERLEAPDTAKNLQLMGQAIEMDVQFLRRCPSRLFQQVYNRCWWYDAPEAKKHFEDHDENPTDLHWNREGRKLHSLLDRWRESYEEQSESDWVESLRPLPNRLDSPLEFVMRGHDGGVETISFSPQGRRLVSGSWGEPTVRIWDLSSGTQISELHGHQERVTSVDYGPNGALVVSGSWDKTVKIWNADQGNELASNDVHKKNVRSVSFCPTRQEVASGSDDGKLYVWDYEKEEVVHCFQDHEGEVTTIDYGPEGERIASGSTDQTVRIWDLTKDGEVFSLFDHEGTVRSVDFGPSGNILVSGGDDGTVKIFFLSDNRSNISLKAHEGWVQSVAISPCGGYVVSSGRDKNVRVWDIGAAKEITRLEGHDKSISSVDFGPGNRIASSSRDKTIRIWNDIQQGKSLEMQGHIRKIDGFAFKPNNMRVASFSRDNTLKVWNINTGRILMSFRHDSWVTDGAFCKKRNLLVSASLDQAIRIWDLADESLLATIEGHEKGVTAVASSDNGELVFSGSYDQTLRIWKWENHEEVAQLGKHPGPIRNIEVDKSGRRVYSKCDSHVLVWDTTTNELIEKKPRLYVDYQSSKPATDAHLSELVQKEQEWGEKAQIFPKSFDHIETMNEQSNILVGRNGKFVYLLEVHK
ncbi:MAG: hypothetical protein ABEL51_08080 [Salinibacter sp.]